MRSRVNNSRPNICLMLAASGVARSHHSEVFPPRNVVISLFTHLLYQPMDFEDYNSKLMQRHFRLLICTSVYWVYQWKGDGAVQPALRSSEPLSTPGNRKSGLRRSNPSSWTEFYQWIIRFLFRPILNSSLFPECNDCLILAWFVDGKNLTRIYMRWHR